MAQQNSDAGSRHSGASAMTQRPTSNSQALPAVSLQRESLQAKEADLHNLVSQQNKDEFFKQITPLLKSLKSYIKRRLRVAYLSMTIRTPVLTSGDILDETILKAYENYSRKRPDLTLEEWLYQIANETLGRYLKERSSLDARRRSLENLSKAELRTLEEPERMTADAEGEIYLVEDLDDSEYQQHDFTPPHYEADPLEQMEKREEVKKVVSALSRLPVQDVMVFELFAMEKFPKDAVAKITGVPAEEVPRIAERVRQHVSAQLQQRFESDERKRA